MVFRSKRTDSDASVGAKPLADLVRAHMPDADEETLRIVTAVAGLLARVAYADRDYSTAERGQVREELARVHGLPRAGVEAICDLLDEDILQIAMTNTQPYTRDLRELTDVELRREVLDVLVDLAAADHVLSMSETDVLRRTATSMGLSQDDYVASQNRHRDRLSLLK